MDLLEAAFLGLIQGLTEFLPVSSSGHLVIGETLLGELSEGIVFEISVHVGTLVAILIFYRRRLSELVFRLGRREPEALRYAAKLAVATLPAVGVGLVWKQAVEALFERPWVTGVALLATSGLLLTTRRTVATARRPEPSWSQALWIGCAQAAALAPGLSRSGATVAVAMALGVEPLAATEFSFLMAVAAISGAGLLALPDVGAATAATLWACLVGAGMAALAGVAALAVFVRLLRSRRFHQFAYYTFAAGGAFLVWLALG